MNYKFFQKILFSLPPEVAHAVTMKALQFAYHCKLQSLFPKKIFQPTNVMGLQFDNPIGLAAGLDKNGDYIDGLAMLGFGFVEVGTITPRPQKGNPRPRLFRLVEDQALINRMGFNNKGSDHLLKNLQNKKYQGILGVNIGKNFDTPNDKAAEDYVYLFKKFAPYASYITVNISSPNTKNLRELQQADSLLKLLQQLKAEQHAFQQLQQKYVPIAVKIAPDLTDEEVISMCEILLSEKIDAVIATNTTLSRNNLVNKNFQTETGGLSGKPLATLSTHIIELIKQHTKNQIPIIGSGGVMSVADVKAKRQAGASLVQLYTGLIYQGPSLIQASLKI